MPIVSLVPALVCAETIATLTTILQQAKAGEIIGVALVVLHPGHDYSVYLAGQTREVPTLTRGTIQALDDQLAAIAGSK